MNLSKKVIVFYLILISIISLGLKLYLIDFTIPLFSDSLDYTLHAIAISNGQFVQHPERHSGWPMLAAPFIKLVDSENFLDYSNTMRFLSITISTMTIFMVYLLGRKFFEKKYAIIMTSLFAFQPHLNHIAGFGLAEPLFFLVLISAFYFILNKETKHVYIAFLIAAILWWIRPSGVMIFLPLSIIYFLNFDKSVKQLRNYAICVVIFLIIASPMLYQRNEQFGNPTYSWLGERIWTGNYEQGISVNPNIENSSPFTYIDENGILNFIERFFIRGIISEIEILAKISFPYLIFLTPIGMLFSIKPIYENKKFLKANWIIVLVTLATMIVPLSFNPERRFLLYIFPFFAIFATITIYRIIEYGLSAFSFSIKQKNIFLILIIFIIIVLSASFTLRFEKPDTILENEKIEFSKFVEKNLDGNILFDAGNSQIYFNHPILWSSPELFKNIKIDESWDDSKPSSFVLLPSKVIKISVYGISLHDLIKNGKEHNLKYIMSTERGDSFYPFVNELYLNEKDFPYLIKIYDSEKEGFKKFKVKVFEIDYEKFNLINFS